jgi:hypothetical protein
VTLRTPRSGRPIYPTIVAVISGLAGSALLARPQRTGALLGLESTPAARLVGSVDLLLVPGLLAGRAQTWLTARAVANVATAALALYSAGPGDSARNARLTAAVLSAATVADLASVRKVPRAGH